MTVRDRLEKLRQHQQARKSGATSPEQSVARSELLIQPSQQKPVLQKIAPPASPTALLAAAARKGAPTPHVPILIPDKQTDYWSIMAKHAAVESEQMRTVEKLAHFQCVKLQRNTLDDQVAQKAKEREQEKLAAVALRLEQETAREKWEAEKREKLEEQRLRASRVKEDRELQVKQLEARREKEKLLRAREEEEMKKEAERQIEEAKKAAEYEKEQQHLRKVALLEANEAQRKEVEERKRKELEQEKFYDEQGRLKAEKEERDRALALQKLFEKMKASDAIAAVNLSAEQDRAALEEVRLRRYEEARQRKEDAVRAAEDAKHALVLEKVKEIQAIQRQAKLIQASELEQQKQQESEELRKILLEEKQQAEERKMRARQKKMTQKQLLECQLRENEQYHLVVVSDIEKTMNKRIIDRALFLQNDGVLPADQLRRASPF